MTRNVEQQGRGRHCTGCALASRRRFLSVAGVTVGAVLARATAIEAKAGSAADEKRYAVPSGDGVSIDRAAEVILVRTGGRIMAFNLACPHENYALRWRDRDLRFQCPEHDSRYQPDGTFIDGRATRHMDRFAIRRDGSEVVVDLNTMYRSDKQPDEWAAAVARP